MKNQNTENDIKRPFLVIDGASTAQHDFCRASGKAWDVALAKSRSVLVECLDVGMTNSEASLFAMTRFDSIYQPAKLAAEKRRFSRLVC